MPRTSTLESPGCPTLRALTTDSLGLIKVVESREKTGIPKVVETWGPPDALRCVLVASFAGHKQNPLLAVGRKNGLVEFFNPMNGDVLATTKVSESNSSSGGPLDDPIVGLHLLGTKKIESSSRFAVFLTCTMKGKACLRSIVTSDVSTGSVPDGSPSTWDVCGSGNIICSSVDASENYALFGGKGVELNLWDLECNNIWTSKFPPRNSLGIFAPTWFTAATFLSKEDHRKIAAGTNNHQVRLYDVSAQRRPVMSFSFRESPIKAVTEDIDGYTLYLGTGSGDLASFDMRTGKLLGCYAGKCCGSIRSIVRHPELPIIAACGLDRYLRFWNTKTRQLLSAVFLKQHLTNVVIDSHFSTEEEAGVHSADRPSSQEVVDHSKDDDELLPARTSASKRKEGSKSKTKKIKNEFHHDDGDDQASEARSNVSDGDEAEDDHGSDSKRRKQSDSRKLKKRTSKKSRKQEESLTDSIL